MNRVLLADYFLSQVGKILPQVSNSINHKLYFIVGSGRCGSTLLNSILSSDRNMSVVRGELNQIFHRQNYPYKDVYALLLPPILKDPKLYTLKSLEYWESNKKNLVGRLNAQHFLSNKNKQIVVKSAMISHMVEHIAVAFPNSFFIHLYRNPVDVVNSLMLKEWEKNKNYFNSKNEFGLACAGYWSDIVTHLHKVENHSLPNRFYSFSYENLVNDPRSALAGLYSYMGLEPSYRYNLEKISDRKATSLSNHVNHKEFENIVLEASTLLGYV